MMPPAKPILLMSTAALLLGCNPVENPTMDESGELLFEIGSGGLQWDELDQFSDLALAGETLSILGPWRGDEQEQVQHVLAYFEHATGVTVNYEGSYSFESDIVSRIDSNNGPDLAIFPQPGLMESLAGQGKLVPLRNHVGTYVQGNYLSGNYWTDLATFENENGELDLYGLFYRTDLKSLVWYSPKVFDQYGYEVPETFEALVSLTNKMVADEVNHRIKPWTIGLKSGDASGWPATDWVEDLLLRLESPELYDRWVMNDLAFDDESVVAAIELFGEFAKDTARVSATVDESDFRDGPSELVGDVPSAFMLKQASFIRDYFPDDAEFGTDFDFFYLPSFESTEKYRPVLGSGTAFSVVKDSDAAHALVDFIASPLAHELWMAQSGAGFLTAHRGANVTVYAAPIVQKQGKIIFDATDFRFDGSDLMRKDIGTDKFWTAMMDFVRNDSEYAALTAAQSLEQDFRQEPE